MTCSARPVCATRRCATTLSVVADPAAWANGYFATVEGPEGRSDGVVAAPVRFSDTPAQPSAVAPELGQHTEEVLLELDFSWEEIGALEGRRHRLNRCPCGRGHLACDGTNGRWGFGTGALART